MPRSAKSSPPQAAEKLLLRFLRHDLAEEVLGDLEEKFYVTAERKSPFRAKLNYWYQVLNYLRPFALRKSKSGPPQRLSNSNSTTMLRHNLLLSFRHFTRHKSSFLINLVGLSSGFTLALLIMAYAGFELTYESGNPKAARIVRITMDYLNGETVVDQDSEAYPPLGSRLTEEFPEVVGFARAEQLKEVNIQVGDDFFRQERVYGVDPSFLELFDYSLIHGSSENIFVNPNEAVLTESLALRYFGRTEVVGETFRTEAPDIMFRIVGVTHDSPPNTHLKFDLLISFPTMLASFGQQEDNWANNNLYSYLLLTGADKLPVLTEHLKQFSKNIEAEGKWENEAVVAQPISDIHLYSDKSYEPEKNGDAASVYILLGVAILVIFIAIANYVNLSTSRALDRAKEVGIRKVVGSSVAQLRGQFITESLMVHLASGLVALALSVLLFDWFKYLANLPASFNLVDSTVFWRLLPALVILGGVLSGIFPALLLSGYKPISVLKGKFSHTSNGNKLRKALVVFQFGITGFLIVQTIIVNQQIKYMRARELGVNVDNTVVVRMPQNRDYSQKGVTFKNEILSYPEFATASISNIVPSLPTSEMGSNNYVRLVGHDEKKGINFYMNFIDQDFIRTMQMEMAAGDNFLPDSENKNRVIVNEEAVTVWGIPQQEQAVGMTLQFWGRTVTISGVVKNFHQMTSKSPYIPMIFIFDPGFSNLVSVRLREGDVRRQVDLLERTYEANFPNSRFEFFFLDDRFDQQYKSDEQFQEIFSLLSGFAILIACLGLFGLTSYTIAQRTKEIGIRKVLGASVAQVVLLVSRDFMSVILLSMLVTLPPTYYLVNSWLQQYAFRIEMNAWYFALPTVLLLVLSFATVFFKALEASSANPAKALRDE